MIRTQISLSEEEYRMAKEAARRSGTSLAEFFRRALRVNLPLKDEKKWMRFCGMVASGNARSSRQIDELIYGQKD